MTIYQMMTQLNNNSLDIVIDNKTLSTKFFKLEFIKFSSLSTWFDVEDFIYYFQTFVTSQIENITKVYNAMNTEYNALENYDKISDIELSNNSSSEMLGSSEQVIDSVTENSATTFNSTDLHIQSKLKENNGKIENAATSIITSGGTTSEHTHGNIGLTTPAQMLKSEYEIREISLYRYIVGQFVNNFCY